MECSYLKYIPIKFLILTNFFLFLFVGVSPSYILSQHSVRKWSISKNLFIDSIEIFFSEKCQIRFGRSEVWNCFHFTAKKFWLAILFSNILSAGYLLFKLMKNPMIKCGPIAGQWNKIIIENMRIVKPLVVSKHIDVCSIHSNVL